MLSNIDERFVQRNERTNVGCRDELVLGLWLGGWLVGLLEKMPFCFDRKASSFIKLNMIYYCSSTSYTTTI